MIFLKKLKTCLKTYIALQCLFSSALIQPVFGLTNTENNSQAATLSAQSKTINAKTPQNAQKGAGGAKILLIKPKASHRVMF